MYHQRVFKDHKLIQKDSVRSSRWGKGKSGKTLCWESVHKRVFKDIGSIQTGKEELHKLIQKDSVRSSRWGKGKSGKTLCWESVHKRVFKDIGSIQTGKEELHKMIQKDSVRSSRWGKGISGKTPGFIMETYFRLDRIWSVTSRLGSREVTGTYFTVPV
jgi:hypothetical protein